MPILGPIPGYGLQEVPSKNCEYYCSCITPRHQRGWPAALYKPKIVQITCGFARLKLFIAVIAN